MQITIAQGGIITVQSLYMIVTIHILSLNCHIYLKKINGSTGWSSHIILR